MRVSGVVIPLLLLAAAEAGPLQRREARDETTRDSRREASVPFNFARIWNRRSPLPPVVRDRKLRRQALTNNTAEAGASIASETTSLPKVVSSAEALPEQDGTSSVVRGGNPATTALPTTLAATPSEPLSVVKESTDVSEPPSTRRNPTASVSSVLTSSVAQDSAATATSSFFQLTPSILPSSSSTPSLTLGIESTSASEARQTPSAGSTVSSSSTEVFPPTLRSSLDLGPLKPTTTVVAITPPSTDESTSASSTALTFSTSLRPSTPLTSLTSSTLVSSLTSVTSSVSPTSLVSSLSTSQRTSRATSLTVPVEPFIGPTGIIPGTTTSRESQSTSEELPSGISLITVTTTSTRASRSTGGFFTSSDDNSSATSTVTRRSSASSDDDGLSATSSTRRSSASSTQSVAPTGPSSTTLPSPTVTPTGTPNLSVPTVIAPALLTTASVSPQTYNANRQSAADLNAVYAGLTPQSACDEGQVACIGGNVMTCSKAGRGEGAFVLLNECAGSTGCFAMPMNNSNAVVVSCVDRAQAAAVLGAGAVDGVPSSASPSRSASALPVTSPSPRSSAAAESTTTITRPQTSTVVVPRPSSSPQDLPSPTTLRTTTRTTVPPRFSDRPPRSSASSPSQTTRDPPFFSFSFRPPPAATNTPPAASPTADPNRSGGRVVPTLTNEITLVPVDDARPTGAPPNNRPGSGPSDAPPNAVGAAVVTVSVHDTVTVAATTVTIDRHVTATTTTEVKIVLG